MNLGWKLAAMVQNRVSGDLEIYQAEWHPAGASLLRTPLPRPR
jgi:hypothetical protein